MEFYSHFCIYNAVQVYLLPGVEFVLYIKDHNGNNFYFKPCVILDKLSVFTTFLSNQKKETFEEYSSNSALLTRGVLQGSILAPIQFYFHHAFAPFFLCWFQVLLTFGTKCALQKHKC